MLALSRARLALWAGLAGVATALALAAPLPPGAAQAAAEGSKLDSIDEGLLRHAPRIMAYLREHNYKNVGILKFRVKQDEKKRTSFNAGLLNTNMAEGLENALVYAHPDDDPIGIIHDATAVAFAHDPGLSYVKEEGRRKLFAYDYPLAWGNGKIKVKPDVFLTGIVKVGMREDRSADPHYTTVAIEAFDARNPAAVVSVMRYEVKTDRDILASSGKGFRLTPKMLARLGKGVGDLDDTLEDLAATPAGGDTATPDAGGNTGTGVTPTDTASGTTTGSPTATPGTPGSPGAPGTGGSPVELTVLYNNAPQAQSPTEGESNGFTLARPPQVGEAVTITLKNNDPAKKYAVVVLVNGVSTLYEEQGSDPVQMSKWILAPGKEYTLRGFYQQGDQTVNPFVVRTPDDFKARHADLVGSDKLGLITLWVMQEGPGGQGELTKGKGFRMAGKGFRAASPSEARRAVASRVKSASRGKNYIGKDDKVEATSLTTDSVQNLITIEERNIRYFKEDPTASPSPTPTPPDTPPGN